MVPPQAAVLAPAMAPAPAAEKINFRGRSFKVAEVSDGPMPVTTPLQPQAPPRESLYSTAGRARAANRTSVLARSQSQAELEEREDGGGGARVGGRGRQLARGVAEDSGGTEPRDAAAGVRERPAAESVLLPTWPPGWRRRSSAPTAP